MGVHAQAGLAYKQQRLDRQRGKNQIGRTPGPTQGERSEVLVKEEERNSGRNSGESEEWADYPFLRKVHCFSLPRLIWLLVSSISLAWKRFLRYYPLHEPGARFYMAKDTKEAKEFAIIQTGGKQYIVAEGDTVQIEKLKGPLTGKGYATYAVGDKVVFDNVLLVDNGKDTSIGMPFIDGAKVSAEVTKISRAKKVNVIKYKAKSNYFKKRGHRQPFFEVKILKLA